MFCTILFRDTNNYPPPPTLGLLPPILRGRRSAGCVCVWGGGACVTGVAHIKRVERVAYLPFAEGINIVRSLSTNVFCAVRRDYASYKHAPTEAYCLKQDPINRAAVRED
jgi:hypothetical protein